MRPADSWKDYELLDATGGNRLERWPSTTAPIRAAASGSTAAVCLRSGRSPAVRARTS